MGAQGEGSKGEENSSTLFFVAALVVAADEAGAGLLGVFFHQERRAALRAGLRHRPVPEGEVALGVVRAGVERAAFLAALLREVAAVLGALDAEHERNLPNRPLLITIGEPHFSHFSSVATSCLATILMVPSGSRSKFWVFLQGGSSL